METKTPPMSVMVFHLLLAKIHQYKKHNKLKIIYLIGFSQAVQYG